MTADGPLAGTGDTVTYTYDASGFVATITDEVALLTQVTAKNASGQPLTIVDPNNITTTMTYDERNRLKTITVNPGASQLVTSFDYYLDGDIKRITRPDGSYFDYTYDDARRLTLITNNSGEKIELGYDAMGNATSRTVKDSASTITYSHTQMFDELGRLLKSIGANSQTAIFAYDKVDSLKTITDPRSHLYSFGYDALNRLISETDQGNAQVNYGLDARNGLQTYTDPRNLVTSYVRNGFGEAIQEASPDAGTTVYYRDARGLVTQSSDGRGVVTNFTYDNAGRMLTRKPVGALSENIVYTWDQIGGGNKGKGRLTKIVDESGTTSWKYNALGQIITDTRMVGANTYATSYTYTGGNLATITYPSGRIVSFTRNALGQISSVTTKLNSSSPSQDVATSIAYKPMSDLVSGFTYGNGLTYAATFTNDYWQKTLKVKDGATSIVNLTYGYSDKINLTAITDNLTAANSLSLGYSLANRLASATGPWGTLSWTYDGVGNRLTETLGATVDTTSYPSTSNKPTNVTRSGSTTRSWTYDGAGNVATDVQSVDAYVYSYDKANRLSSVTDNASPWATYKYNGLDQLASRTVTAPVGPPGTIQYIYDLDGHLIAEADSATATTLANTSGSMTCPSRPWPMSTPRRSS